MPAATAAGLERAAWSSQFGCYDPSLDQIVMNRRLDRPDVPAFAVEFILYHEMLHVKHPIRAAACGLQSHSPEFRAEEKRFAHYARARKFLERVRWPTPPHSQPKSRLSNPLSFRAQRGICCSHGRAKSRFLAARGMAVCSVVKQAS